MQPQAHFRLVLLSVILVFIALELGYAYRRGLKLYNWRETWANLGLLLGMNLAKLLFIGYELAVLGFFEAHALHSFERTFPNFLLCFLAVDFVYYWYHRSSHEWPWLWAFHMVHHSAERMNFTASFRLNWFAPLVTTFFFAPLAVIGFSPIMIMASLAINLALQFFLHTETVGKLGPLEGWLNTPSAHRVHHGRNPIYLDRNHGGILMIWDRLFGTYQEEVEAVNYGVTTGFNSGNPFRLVTRGFMDYLGLSDTPASTAWRKIQPKPSTAAQHAEPV